MDKNYDGSVTIDEFLDVFLQAERILIDKTKAADANIQEFVEQRKKVIKDFENAECDEQLNDYNISKSSDLSLICVRAQGLSALTTKNVGSVFIQASVNDKAKTSEDISNSDAPMWNFSCKL